MRGQYLKEMLRKIYRAADDDYTEFFAKNCGIKHRKIVFDNFFGRGYGDNPKYIAEEIHRRGLNWDMVWLLDNTNVELPPYLRTVEYGSNAARRELSSAKVIVNNVRNSMRMPKKKGQIYLQTWHGGLSFKLVEKAAEETLSEDYVNSAKRDGNECDAIISACAIQSEDYRKNFWLNPNTEILEVGQPRCDSLLSCDQKTTEERVRKSFGIPENAMVVLYAPTFRDDGTVEGYALELEQIADAFENSNDRPCCVIVRMHPNAQRYSSTISYNNRVLNGSTYPDIQELYVAADVLITDYSSAAFDCSLLRKPVFICALDLEEYKKKRGLTDTFNLVPFPKSYSNEELLESIRQFRLDDYITSLDDFIQNIWQPFDDGHAAEKVVDWLQMHT